MLRAKTWYVWMGCTLSDAFFTTRYIGRYTKRPAIAESRITDYDGNTVTFEYQDKKAGIFRRTTLSVLEFIGRLIRHIPERYFRMIRYSGILSNRTRGRDIPLARDILKLQAGKNLEPLSWRQRRLVQNGIDPLLCSVCGKEMVLVEVAFRTRDGPLRVWQFDNERANF
jgi:Putative transposase